MPESFKKSQCAEVLPNSADKQSFADYSNFDPHAYVAEYYSELGPENQFLLKFYHKAYQHIPRGARVLEFGGGPTVYQLLSAAKTADEITFADYLDCNRTEVTRWLRGDPKAINWDSYIDFVLKLDRTETTKEEYRKNVSKKVTNIIECDANLPDMLGALSSLKFDVVSSGFCLDCISSSEAEFVLYLRKLTSFLRTGGTLLLSSLLKADSYTVGDLTFSSFSVDRDLLEKILKNLGYRIETFDSIGAEHSQGYEGLMAVRAILLT